MRLIKVAVMWQLTCDIVTLIKQRLPEYIVNCFMSSGYNEMEVISTMDTSDKEHNGPYLQ